MILHACILVLINAYDWLNMHTCACSDMEWLAIFSLRKKHCIDDGSCMMARALGQPLAKIGYLVGTRRQYGLAHASECIELIHAETHIGCRVQGAPVCHVRNLSFVGLCQFAPIQRMAMAERCCMKSQVCSSR